VKVGVDLQEAIIPDWNALRKLFFRSSHRCTSQVVTGRTYIVAITSVWLCTRVRVFVSACVCVCVCVDVWNAVLIFFLDDAFWKLQSNTVEASCVTYQETLQIIDKQVKGQPPAFESQKESVCGREIRGKRERECERDLESYQRQSLIYRTCISERDVYQSKSRASDTRLYELKSTCRLILDRNKHVYSPHPDMSVQHLKFFHLCFDK